MNHSKYNPKLDPKNNNAGHASVTVPSASDTGKGNIPAQAEKKHGEAKPAVQAPGTSGTGNTARSNGQDHNPPARKDDQATVKAADGDKTGSEAMVSEGGHTAANDAHRAVREPDASTTGKTEPLKGSADGAADKPRISAKSTS